MARRDEKESRRIYNRIAERYHAARTRNELFYNEYLEVPAFLSVLGNIRGRRVLDVGCGSGISAKLLKARGAQVSGIDASERMIEIARREAAGVDFKVGSIYKMPYPNRHFDLVTASLVVEHLRRLKIAFVEINRVLKRNGVFVFSTHNPVVAATHTAHKTGKGNRRDFCNYFDEGLRYTYWNRRQRVIGRRAIRMPLWHVTYQTLIRTILASGFAIEDYVDARPAKEGRRANPDAYAVTSTMPYFCVFRVRKL